MIRLQGGVRPPKKTYAWIAQGFKDHRKQRKLSPDLSGSVHDTITELLIELTDRQVRNNHPSPVSLTPTLIVKVYPREEVDTPQLEIKHLKHLQQCLYHLLQPPDGDCTYQHEEKTYLFKGTSSKEPPPGWGSGAGNDVQRGVRSEQGEEIKSISYA